MGSEYDVPFVHDLIDELEKSKATTQKWYDEAHNKRRELRNLEEQFEALRDIAVRVSEADNQRLAAEGEPGFQAMREMEDALAALHQFVASNPASRSSDG
jgi:uncharacterized protein YjiS (DUF1127 family)